MDAPHLSLEVALKDSIASGTFIDTKFYIFSRREASGRVCSPRALYCNSSVLDTVPSISTLFSEGQTSDIDGSFPTDSRPFTEDYDYLSDSDLEDEFSCSGEEHDRNSRKGLEDAPDPKASQTLDNPAPNLSLVEVGGTQNNERPNDNPARTGKVVIIPDVGAVTFEAMLYFLYTGEIKFAPFSSDPCHGVPTKARTGDWRTGRLPSPSAKSIYRLADKYDIPALKEQAKTHIHNSLEHCDIAEEVFSSFSSSFPEILSMQVSQLVYKMKDESKEGTEGATRKRLREKIAALPQSQLTRAIDTLAMIWNGATGLLETPAVPKLTPDAILAPCRSSHRVKLALLKSIPTGTFIDVQFYAYNAISNDLPLDPRPLFTSSIVIEEWGAAIATQTVGTDRRTTRLVGGPADDYESWNGTLPEELPKDRTGLQYRTEAAAAESRGVVILTLGAWKTWMSLLSYAYTNEMPFGPLQILTQDGAMVADAEPHSCSPRSMYSLAATLGIETIEKDALKDIQSKLSTSNIVQELFSSFTASHKAVLDMEIQFLHELFTEKDPRLLMGHIQKMASGDAPFLPTALSLVYDKLVENAFPKHASPSSGLSRPGGVQGVTIHPPPYPNTPIRASIPILSGLPPPTSSTTITWNWARLKCTRCNRVASVYSLRDDLYCPRCHEESRSGKGRPDEGRPLMRCTECDAIRHGSGKNCLHSTCGGIFM